MSHSGSGDSNGDQAPRREGANGEDWPMHDARILTGGGNTAQIRLGDQVYTLRITRAGKLILTK